MTCPNHASFRLLTVAGKGSCGPKEVDLAPQPVVGPWLQTGDAEKFSQGLSFESLTPYFFQSQHGLYFIAIEEDGVDKRHGTA